jgi:hypothetical protein
MVRRLLLRPVSADDERMAEGGNAVRHAHAGEIVYWFLVTSTPIGGAPEHIRGQWVGVPLPVRRPRPVEGPEPHVARNIRDRRVSVIPDGVAVAGPDALRALELFDRPEAAAWWSAHLATSPSTSALAFRTSEGRLMPPSFAVRRFPELDAFDDE